MKASAFYDLAMRLASESQPAELRSAISRAYYGAFHTAVELLQDFGIQLPDGPECHTKVRFILDNAGSPELLTASARLSALRLKRNLADYDLSSRDPERKGTVVLNLRQAQEAIDSLNRCATAGTRDAHRDTARQYAKNVLGLPVS